MLTFYSSYLDLQWNEEFVVIVPKPTSNLVMTLWEKHASKKKEKNAGSVYLSWSDLSPWRLLERKVPITDSLTLSVMLEFGPMQVPDTTPESTKLPEMRFAFERLTYWPGEVVRGVLTLSLSQARRIQGLQLRFNGFNYIDWYDPDTDAFFTGTDIYFTKREMLLGQAPPPSKKLQHMAEKNGENLIYMKEEFVDIGLAANEFEGVEVESGVHHFPFAFSLPINVPPSMTLMDDCVGIFYFIEAHLFELGHGNHHAKKPTIERQTLLISAAQPNLEHEPSVAPIETETIIISRSSPLSDQYSTSFHNTEEATLETAQLAEGLSPPKTTFAGLDFLEQSHLKTEKHITDVDLDGDTDDAQWLSKQSETYTRGEGHHRPQSPFDLGASPTEHGLGVDHRHHYRDGQDIDEEPHGDDRALSPRFSEREEAGSSDSRPRSGSRHKNSPILISAVLPPFAAIGKHFTFQVTIENRSSKPVNSLRVQLQSRLKVNGYPGGRVYKRLHESCSDGVVLRTIEKELPQFPVQPGTAWRGNVTINIPKDLYASIKVRHLFLSYELNLEARTSHKILSGHLVTPFHQVSNHFIIPITVAQVSAEKDLRLIKPPTSASGDPCQVRFFNVAHELETAIVPIPIAGDGSVPVTGFIFPEAAFASDQ